MKTYLELDQSIEPSGAERGHVSLRGYLESLPYKNDELIARLLRITGNAPLRRAYNSEKSTFEFVGRFYGHYFCLYDYKGGSSIHVGGDRPIEPLITMLEEALIERCKDLKPVAFQAVGCYGDYTIRRAFNLIEADFRFMPPYPEVVS